jgi:hypothetical protein
VSEFIAVGADIPQTAKEYFQTDDPFFTRLLDGLKGSGKRVVLIDMGTDDPNYHLRAEDVRANDALNAHIERAGEHPDDKWWRVYDSLLLEYKIADARSNECREHVMRGQVEELLATSVPGSRITIMAGVVHTPISYRSSQLRYTDIDGNPVRASVSRTFVPTAEAEASLDGSRVRIQFNPRDRDIRHLTQNLKRFGLSTLDNAE